MTPEKVEEALLNPDTLIKLATELKAEREARKHAELEAANGELKGTINRGTIESRLRDLATNEKVVSTAMDDVIGNHTGVDTTYRDSNADTMRRK